LFLARFYRKVHSDASIYVSNPTWANHHQIFSNVGLPLAGYPYWHPTTRGLDISGMLQALEKAPEYSIILLHPCAHNPTGVDPTQEQWKQISEVMKRRKQFPFFDCAYQGFASGDLSKDGWAIRYFINQGFEMLIAQSYAKNFGLYGERAGCFHYVAGPSENTKDQVARVSSQLAILQRSEISNPPAYGARIASLALNDPKLFEEWEANLRTMSSRIIDMRKALRGKLEELKTPGKWNHITDQIGMFSFTGLNEKQVARLKSDGHIYMTKNGRISMAGLNTKNVDYVATQIDKVIRGTQ
jgi:aspartate aminotransferase, cytoplasmic